MYAVRLPSVCGNAGQHVGALGRNFAARQLSMSLVCVEMLDSMWQPLGRNCRLCCCEAVINVPSVCGNAGCVAALGRNYFIMCFVYITMSKVLNFH